MRSRLSNNGVLQFALVGLGYWGPNHLRVLQNNESAELRWICDQDAERLEHYRQGIANGTMSADRIDAVLADPVTDAVILATPIGTHFDLAKRCLEAGKHVLVEKPLAGTLEETEQLAELARANDL